MFEARQGNLAGTRDIFEFLIKKSDNDEFYVEYSKFEEREQNLEGAVEVCHRGFNDLPESKDQSSLWFQYLRLFEKASNAIRKSMYHLEDIENYLKFYLKQEFKWKADLELAQVYERLC